MDRQTTNLDSLLKTLGEAHRDGMFESASSQLPWKASPKTANVVTRRRHSWFWVGAPLAAAAAIAILFVGPALIPGRAAPEFAKDVKTNLLPQHPEVLADAGTSSESTPMDCDYNGDGVVDGRDIQALVERSRDTTEDPKLQAEKLQRCLLGS